MFDHGSTAGLPFPARNTLITATGAIAVSLMPAWIAWARNTFDISIRVVLTKSAEKLTSRPALTALTGRSVAVDAEFFDGAGGAPHVALAQWADVIMVAPASANTVAKIAHGIADNLVLNIVSCAECPVIVAPSVNAATVNNAAYQRNIARLAADGYGVVPTFTGKQLDGRSTPGAMPDAPMVFEYAKEFLAGKISESIHG
jgi:phosphopantothenoylcysteine decarboxylase/phosphopantothenate--cysteine ligase